MAYSECLPTRLNPLAERTCFSQVADLRRANAALQRAQDTGAAAAAAAAGAVAAAAGAADYSGGGDYSWQRGAGVAAAREAGSDEGLLSFSLSILLYMVNPHSYEKCR